MRYLRVAGVLLAALALAALLLAACGGDDDAGEGDDGGGTATVPADDDGDDSGDGDGDDDSGNGGASLDACELLTADDVEPLLGERPDAEQETVGLFDTCGYYATETFEFVQLQVCECLTGDDFDSSMEASAEALEVDVVDVSRVGDKAAWIDGILWTTNGDATINVWIATEEYNTAADDADAIEATAELANEILDRLP
jgi:hypothetical protein